LPPQIRALVVFTLGYTKNIWREIDTLLRGNIFQRSSVSDLIFRCFKDDLKVVDSFRLKACWKLEIMLNLTMLVSGSKIGGMVWLENSKEWPYFFSSIDDDGKCK
jgi:hypothetical protein